MTALPLPSRPPEAPGLPVVGNLPNLALDVLGFMTHLTRTQGDVVRVKLGPREVWVLGHPRDIEFVHVNTGPLFDKGLHGEFILDRLLGNGLLLSESDFWLRQRRLAQPAFHRQRIQGYVEVMRREAERVRDRWLASVGQVVDAHADMTDVTLNIVCKAVLDTEPGAGTNSTVARQVDVVLDAFRRNLGNPWRRANPPRILGGRRVETAAAEIDAIVSGIIAERRAEGRDRGDLLSMLLAARDDDGTGMTEVQLLDEVKNIFLAGFDTTASSLSFAFMLLAQHPSAESRLHAELDAVLGDRTPDLADLGRLPFTEAVLKETWRLYPPAWSTQRLVRVPTELGGYPVAPGTPIWINHYVTHRDPRFFDHAEEFRPERWLNGLEGRLPKFAYFPFGGGGRVCIGRDFAKLEAMIVLATLAQHARLRLARPVSVQAAITLRPRGGVQVMVSRRR